MRRTRLLTTLVIPLALAAAAHGTRVASAASLYLTDVAPATSMNVAFPGISYTPAPLVGGIQWTFDRNDPANAGLGALVPGNTLTTFCIEGTQDVAFQTTNVYSSILQNVAATPQDDAGSLYQMGPHASRLNAFWDAYYAQSSADAVHSSAFQLGVWEIVYDNGTDLTSGGFAATPDLSDPNSAAAYLQAQAWLSTLNSQNPATHYDLFVLSDPALQDQLFGIAHPPAVPVPAALPTGTALLAGLGLLRKYRTHKP